jgi:tetratricopeptide (TPR) repeat protein
LAALAGSLAAVKRFENLGSWETQALIGALSLLGLLKLWYLFKQQTTSIFGVGGVIVLVVMVGAAALIGIPEQARQIPSLMDLTLLVVPLLLFAAATMAALWGLAKWRGPGEFGGMAQHQRLLIALNLILAATAWQIVRQSSSLPLLQGLVQLPELRTRRVAVEQMVQEMLAGLDTGPALASIAAMTNASPGSVASGAFPTAPAGYDDEPLRRARAAEQRGDFASAAVAWSEAGVMAGHDPFVEAMAIRSFILAGKCPEALGRLERLRGSGFDSPDLQLLHARLLSDTGRFGAAADLYEPILVANHGSDDDVRRFLGILIERGETARALRATERLLVKRPNRRLHRWRACLQAAEGDYENALATLRQLMLTTPFDPVDAYKLGEIAREAGRPQVTLSAVNSLLRAGENTPRTTRLAAYAYGALGLPFDSAGFSGSSTPPAQTGSVNTSPVSLGQPPAGGS